MCGGIWYFLHKLDNFADKICQPYFFLVDKLCESFPRHLRPHSAWVVLADFQKVKLKNRDNNRRMLQFAPLLCWYAYKVNTKTLGCYHLLLRLSNNSVDQLVGQEI